MSEIMVTEVKGKSNAPWILGLVGFGLSIPQVICSILCTGISMAASDMASEMARTSDASKMADGVAASGGFIFMLPVFCTFICFILSFFGKTSKSMTTGVLLIILGLADIGACIVNFSFLGIAAGICFFCSGISSVCNAKKVK